MHDSSRRDSFIKWLVASIKCGICGQHYEAANVKIMGHQDELWFLSVFCSSCKSHGLIAAVVKENEPVQLTTDLSEEEYAKFARSSGVEIDDVLDIHNLLENFSGDISELLSNEQP